MSSGLNDRAAESSGIVATAGLVYVAMPGIRRVRTADGFVYMLTESRRLTDQVELKRVASLATPPAYEDVWMCSNQRGHLQATGRDARGRKQYRYHPKWRLFHDVVKFERMPAFGEALPRLRRRLHRDLAQEGLPREKVLAVIVT
jgi:DNA topoisomerase-1